ncbi:MAG TPA: OsmC family protein, partial [Syntrophobacteraceae bacterium]|nr:OsmC family protein [Syntrophobacteraceae bacterium]
GKNLGANPVEFVLTALSGCLTTSLIAQAAVRGIRLRKVESRLEGDLDVRGFLGMSEEVRNGYRNIRVTFKIKGDASQEELRELLELARKRSPVFDIVSHPVPVSVELEA